MATTAPQMTTENVSSQHGHPEDGTDIPRRVGVSREEEWFDDEAGPVVRPYAVTGGRTRPSKGSLELVALVTTTSHGRAAAASLDHEQRAIAALCLRLQSIVEIS